MRLLFASAYLYTSSQAACRPFPGNTLTSTTHPEATKRPYTSVVRPLSYPSRRRLSSSQQNTRVLKNAPRNTYDDNKTKREQTNKHPRNKQTRRTHDKLDDSRRRQSLFSSEIRPATNDVQKNNVHKQTTNKKKPNLKTYRGRPV